VGASTGSSDRQDRVRRVVPQARRTTAICGLWDLGKLLGHEGPLPHPVSKPRVEKASLTPRDAAEHTVAARHCHASDA